jgi:hypothetical protein
MMKREMRYICKCSTKRPLNIVAVDDNVYDDDCQLEAELICICSWKGKIHASSNSAISYEMGFCRESRPKM